MILKRIVRHVCLIFLSMDKKGQGVADPALFA